MSNYESKTIAEAMSSIYANTFVLPSIQRRFVWKENQIKLLFDSLLRGYPIGVFMLWELKPNPEEPIKINFYGFEKSIESKKYKKSQESKTYKKSTRVMQQGETGISAVIDGQQRLTALYTGLKSTYGDKMLYVHLVDRLSIDGKEQDIENNEEQSLYKFEFYHSSELDELEDSALWFKVGDIHLMSEELREAESPSAFIAEYNRNLCKERNIIGAAETEAMKTLDRLFSVIHLDKKFIFFNEKNQKIEHILSTFVRINQGGTKLEKSDFLFALIESQRSDNFRDTVEEILLKTSSFGIEKDFILKVAFALSDLPIKLTTSNFKAIVDKFDTLMPLQQLIIETFEFLGNTGYTANMLTKGQNVLVPIVYYLYYKQYNNAPLYENINSQSIKSDHLIAERKAIYQWLLLAITKKLFSNSTDSKMTQIRSIIKQQVDANKDTYFPIDAIITELSNKSTSTKTETKMTATEVDKLLKSAQYGEPRTLMILSLVQENLPIGTALELDHLHAKSQFYKNNQKKHLNEEDSIPKADLKDYNNIANLAIIPKTHNREKSDKLLEEWLKEHKEKIKVKDLLINDTMPLDFQDFKDFADQRRAAIKERLLHVLS